MTDKSATRPGVLDAGKKRSSRRGVDWDSIEAQYRAGHPSVRQIALEANVSEAAIRKKAKEKGWQRDLAAQVQDKAKAKLEERPEKLVAEPVDEPRERPSTRAADPQRDEQIIEQASDTVVNVVRGHRKTIRESRELLETMLSQLTEAVTEREVVQLEIEQATEDSPKLRNRYLRAVSLPAQATTLRDLSLTLRNLVALEREAFGIETTPVAPVAQQLLQNERSPGFEDLRAAFIKRLASKTVH